MFKRFVCALVLAATIGANTAPQAARPPNGTYVYAASAGGATVFTSTVVVAGSGDTFTVTESAKLNAQREAVVKTTYSSVTLLPLFYELHQKAMGTNTDLTAKVDAKSMKFEGAPISFTALAGTDYLLFGEGLNAYKMMMPWSALANGGKPFTFAAINGNFTAAGTVVPVTRPRPPRVDSADSAVAFDIGKDQLTAWYNPQTHVTDEVDVASGPSTLLVKYDPAVSALSAPSRVSHLPLPAARYTERAVSIHSDGAVLSGVLAIPGTAKKYPAIVFVHGSGAGTRDGGTQANPTFLALSNALANSGVAVLRYDKRGIAKSTGKATEDWRPLSRDVKAAVDYLRRQPQIDPGQIYVLGHSEGGFIAPMIANTTPIRGIVVMAGPAISMQAILLKQGVASLRPAERAYYEKMMQPYAGYDPAEIIKRVNRPMLLLQGGKDGQVLLSDFQRLVRAAKQTHRNATIVVFPQDDHLFIRLPDSQGMQSGEIFTPHELDPRLPAAILQWIKKTGAKPIAHA